MSIPTSNFYNEGSFRFIEIGIAQKDIDRINPGKVPFIIPSLTPQMETGSMKDSKIIQRDKSNIMNQSSGSVEVSDISMSNYLYIEIPKEMCAQPEAEYKVKGELTIEGYTTMRNGSSSSKVTLSNFSISGSVSDPGNTASGNGSVTEYAEQLSGEFTGKIHVGKTEGILFITPTDKWRYIKKGSRWAIAFIGGDVNLPIVLGRLPDK